MSQNPDSGERHPQDDLTSGAGTPDLFDSGAGQTAGEISVAEEPSPAGTGSEPPTGGLWGDDEREPSGHPRMSFLDHLEELRTRIIRSILAIVVGFGICWYFRNTIYAGLAQPIMQVLRDLKLPEQLVYTSPTGVFSLYVQMALLGGVFVAAPYVMLQVWGFISPGLYPHEKRYAAPFVFLCSSLFIAGGAFAYFMAFPAALRFLLSFSMQFQPMITVNEYFGLAMTVILGLALIFELPVLILLLTLLRILTPGFLLRNTRYAVLLIIVSASLISPTTDVPNLILFSAPMLLLYFFGIGLSWLVLRMRRREET
jgi:sec-independent protein translocase protein TatC